MTFTSMQITTVVAVAVSTEKRVEKAKLSFEETVRAQCPTAETKGDTFDAFAKECRASCIPEGMSTRTAKDENPAAYAKYESVRKAFTRLAKRWFNTVTPDLSSEQKLDKAVKYVTTLLSDRQITALITRLTK
ncbi:MAG: hypothetical protein QGI09_08665 [Dehalococcoidia bacterium]|nr:hypothetical protein [Dehalococcoidia bacterium]